MAKAKKCDICGGFFEIKDDMVDFVLVANTQHSFWEQQESTLKMDACPDCVNSILAHIESLKPEVDKLELPNESEN